MYDHYFDYLNCRNLLLRLRAESMHLNHSRFPEFFLFYSGSMCNIVGFA